MLDRVTYQKALGTMGRKAQRVVELTGRLCAGLEDLSVNESAALEIARLAYGDLVCAVVKEFPELQGAMGGLCPRRRPSMKRVALRIEFYHPSCRALTGAATAEGALASLAGKLDSLAEQFRRRGRADQRRPFRPSAPGGRSRAHPARAAAGARSGRGFAPGAVAAPVALEPAAS